MRAREWFDGGRLAGRLLADVTTVARDAHRATAATVFDAVGPAGFPVRLVHDAVSAVAYGSTHFGVRTIPAAAGVVGAGVQAVRGDGAGGYDTPAGRVALSAVAGILGDTLAADHPALAPPLAVRTHGRPLRTAAAALWGDLVDDRARATGRVVVFAHGLCESDLSWRRAALRSPGDPDATYGSLLARDAGWTPLYLTYNSGRHVSDNGRAVADLLAQVVAGWPVPVTEVALVGHSMGGLVLRSAVAQAVSADRPDDWIAHLRHLVFLGSPHLGAPLERSVHRATTTLARRPETAPFAAYLRRRSVGVKDLRHGAVVAADWEGRDLDADLPDRCTVVDLPPGVAVHTVAVTVASRPDSVLGRLAGDLLVGFESAGSLGHPTRSLPGGRVQHFGGLHHFDLLGHPAVYDALRAWLR